LGCRRCIHSCIRISQFTHDVFSRPMNSQNQSPLKPRGLLRRWGLKWLRVRTEPDFDNPVALQALVNSAGNCLDFR